MLEGGLGNPVNLYWEFNDVISISRFRSSGLAKFKEKSYRLDLGLKGLRFT